VVVTNLSTCSNRYRGLYMCHFNVYIFLFSIRKAGSMITPHVMTCHAHVHT
jgi:hypothetical protein